MVGVNGVSIAGGSFTNSKSTNGNDIADWGYGIWATDAGFRIVPACQLGSIPPVCQGTGFNGLGYGVYTSKLWENRPYTVQGANFTNCFMGHYNRLVIDGTVLQNTFNMGSLPDTEASNGIQIGAEFEGVINSFLVEENHFIKNTASENIITLGTVCYETGAFLRNIRLNDYTSLTVGNLANGLNRGIRYLCNTNQNASYTSFIPPWDFYVSEGGQINGNQGIPVPGFPITYQSAANTFSYAPGETGSDFTNSTNLVRYHYEVLAAFAKPEDVIGNFDDEVANQSNGCLPTYCTPPCPEPPPTPTPKNEFYAYQSAWHTSLQEYAANPTPEKAEVVAFHRAGMDEYGGKVIHAILLDTIAYHQDTLRQWLSNMETYETDLMLATDFYRTGQPAEGQQILNAATTKFGLNSEQQLDLGRYTTILNTLSGKSPYMLDSISLATISSYIESGGCVEALARNILAANGVHFPPKYILPEEVQERSNPVTIESRGVDSLLSVYPNPASDRVSFLLHFPPTASSIFLRVIDLNGKTVHLSSSLPPVGELVWPTQDLPNGIYFYHLIAVGIPPHSGSIIVHR